MKSLILKRRSNKNSQDIPSINDSDSEELTTGEYLDDEPNEHQEDSRRPGDHSRRNQQARRPKTMTCVVRFCINRRFKPHLLFCDKHWRCIPSVLRDGLKMHYHPYLEKQTDEFFEIGKAALRFAKKGIPQPPFTS